jgi:hypothetical protein
MRGVPLIHRLQNDFRERHQRRIYCRANPVPLANDALCAPGPVEIAIGSLQCSVARYPAVDLRRDRRFRPEGFNARRLSILRWRERLEGLSW